MEGAEGPWEVQVSRPEAACELTALIRVRARNPTQGRPTVAVIIVAGTIHVAPADRDRYLVACSAVMERARRTPGCLDFALSPDSIAEDQINVFERWESDDQLVRFRDAGPDPRLPEIREAKVVEYRVFPSAE